MNSGIFIITALNGTYGDFRLNFEYQFIHQLNPFDAENGKTQSINKKHRIRHPFMWDGYLEK
jgi:hypothetical protein